MKDFFLKLLGYKYLLNTNTLEVHSLKKQTKACRLNLMADHNKKYMTKKQVKKLLGGTTLHNGCRYCMNEFDKG